MLTGVKELIVPMRVLMIPVVSFLYFPNTALCSSAAASRQPQRCGHGLVCLKLSLIVLHFPIASRQSPYDNAGGNSCDVVIESLRTSKHPCNVAHDACLSKAARSS